MYKLCGIPNCNTVKKAQAFLDDNQVEYEFVNFKKQVPTLKQLTEWKSAYSDWPVNKKGPTFRKIKEQFEAADAKGKKLLMQENTSSIKRPILIKNGQAVCFGFSEEAYQELV